MGREMMQTDLLHPLQSTAPSPPRFTYPFCYEPHPLCIEAAAAVRRHLAAARLMEKEHGGKMFGVLIVGCADGTRAFLAAYSGLLVDRNDWPYFVPPVFDAQRPDGYFKTEERRISALTGALTRMEQNTALLEARAAVRRLEAERDEALARQRLLMAGAKARRDARRAEGPLSTAVRADLERESQHMKADLRRLRQRYAVLLDEAHARLRPYTDAIARIREGRRMASEALQTWLFDQYDILDACGHRRTITSIFADTRQGTPPAGAGDCCAPKLLQYAYLHGLRPLAMGEFWVGPSPKGEIRHDGQFYPACRGKCLPILRHALQGLDVDPNPLASADGRTLRVLYEDDVLAVVVKPDGLQSVPGTTGADSVWSLARRRWPQADGPLLVHRLDMATSGLMLIAKTMAAYRALQDQFARREVSKMYLAVLDGVVRRAPSGHIDLPLRPDLDDRPRQVVDAVYGRQTLTDYRVLGSDGRVTRVALFPHTGRTHQLRVHCAHADGLGCPIVGDALYGRSGGRLMLHAGRITFRHPVTGEVLTFEAETPW